MLAPLPRWLARIKRPLGKVDDFSGGLHGLLQHLQFFFLEAALKFYKPEKVGIGAVFHRGVTKISGALLL